MFSSGLGVLLRAVDDWNRARFVVAPFLREPQKESAAAAYMCMMVVLGSPSQGRRSPCIPVHMYADEGVTCSALAPDATFPRVRLKDSPGLDG